jgi:hypothetical protein
VVLIVFALTPYSSGHCCHLSGSKRLQSIKSKVSYNGKSLVAELRGKRKVQSFHFLNDFISGNKIGIRGNASQHRSTMGSTATTACQ